jgi:hypothetical protein
MLLKMIVQHPQPNIFFVFIVGGESMVKYANEGILDFFVKSIHKLSLNTLNS